MLTHHQSVDTAMHHIAGVMNNAVELEARPRPLSTGLWTLFSWLRRDERSDSSDSLSSAGSDRTVASFAFLAPAHYQPATAPFVLPPPGPPTDSYKKRVHDRNVRRQYDRDITLHRKYGLFKSGEPTCSYDAFSLPPARRLNGDSCTRWDRDRRATSECYQRRLAHVPGKRRAPLPPVTSAPTTPATSLTRRNTRKRRAPQPPVKSIEKHKDNLRDLEIQAIITQMNPQPLPDNHKLRNNDVSMGCKSEKYSKKEGCAKETKVKSEKNFLKHIFDSKKRNSGIDISSVKLLPSISELDKQAAEIIETRKLNTPEQNNNANSIISHKAVGQRSSQVDTWICVSCLKKYNSSVITCPHCLPNQKANPQNAGNDETPSTSKATNSFTQTEKNLHDSASSNKNAAEEKQKLKEMLKEMKDSLPKRPKHDSKTNIKTIATIEVHGSNSNLTETPTLRVGSTVESEHKISSSTQPITENIVVKPASPAIAPSSHKQLSAASQPAASALVTPVRKKYFSDSNNVVLDSADMNINKANSKPVTNIQKVNASKVSHSVITEQLKDKKDLNTPLKISSLLNPVYVPKKIESNKLQMSNASQVATKTEKQEITDNKIDDRNKTVQATVNTTSAALDALPSSSKSQVSRLPVSVNKDNVSPEIQIEQKPKDLSGPPLSDKPITPKVKNDKNVGRPLDNKILNLSASIKENSTNIVKDNNAQDQHSRRRELIHQLEQSIAKGDERAAAEAAAKLAQLRLSCSVLSFSSQILSEPFTSTATPSLSSDMSSSNKPPPNNNVSEQGVKKDLDIKQTNPLVEKIPQKEVVNATTSTGLLKSNETATVASKTETVKVKPAHNSQEAIIKKILLEPKKENKAKTDTMIT